MTTMMIIFYRNMYQKLYDSLICLLPAIKFIESISRIGHSMVSLLQVENCTVTELLYNLSY